MRDRLAPKDKEPFHRTKMLRKYLDRKAAWNSTGHRKTGGTFCPAVIEANYRPDKVYKFGITHLRRMSGTLSRPSHRLASGLLRSSARVPRPRWVGQLYHNVIAFGRGTPLACAGRPGLPGWVSTHTHARGHTQIQTQNKNTKNRTVVSSRQHLTTTLYLGNLRKSRRRD